LTAIAELAGVVAPFGGLYDSHDRDPAFNLLQSVAECLEIGRRADIAAHVAHLKAVGRRNAQLTPDLIRMIEAARSAGEAVTADVYPYDGAATRLIPEILVAPASSAIARNQALLADVSANEAARATALRELVADLRSALHGSFPDEMKLLLAHNPVIVRQAARFDVDLVLSGHTHGGQVKWRDEDKRILPNRSLKNGLHRRKNTQIYITRGIGTVVLPIRYQCPPEISLIELRCG
jgi:hypothetical protein